jgi:hypothetical protein
MSGKRYTLESLSNLVLPDEEITVEDSRTGETKTIKTVSRAEVAAITAYMLGIDDGHLEEYYSHHYGLLMKQLRESRAATTIRYLSKIRTTIMNHFLNIDNEMRYNLSNLDRMHYFDKGEIQTLFKWGVYVVQPNFRSDKYMVHLTKLMDEHIDSCKDLFPETVHVECIALMTREKG